SAKRSRQRAPQNKYSTPSCTWRCLVSADTVMPQTGSLDALLAMIMQCSAFPTDRSQQNIRRYRILTNTRNKTFSGAIARISRMLDPKTRFLFRVSEMLDVLLVFPASGIDEFRIQHCS